MNIVTLSNYTNNTLVPISIIPFNKNVLNVGNLIIKEYYKKENDETFSYSRETMIITDVYNNHLEKIKIQPVIKVDKSANIAYIDQYDETIYLVNGKWVNEGNMDKDISCDNISPILNNNYVYKTLISKGYLFEKDGIQIKNLERINDFEKPEWCQFNPN